MMKVKYEVEIELSLEEVKVLYALLTTPQYNGVSSGWWEFRDGMSKNCRAGKLSGPAASSLCEKNLIDYNEDSWHPTVGLTDIGKKIAEQLQKPEDWVIENK